MSTALKTGKDQKKHEMLFENYNIYGTTGKFANVLLSFNKGLQDLSPALLKTLGWNNSPWI